MWRPYPIADGKNINKASLRRDAFTQISRGIDTTLEWTYEHNVGLRATFGAALIFAGMFAGVNGAFANNYRIKTALIGGSILSEFIGLGLLWSTSRFGYYQTPADERKK